MAPHWGLILWEKWGNSMQIQPWNPRSPTKLCSMSASPKLGVGIIGWYWTAGKTNNAERLKESGCWRQGAGYSPSNILMDTPSDPLTLCFSETNPSVEDVFFSAPTLLKWVTQRQKIHWKTTLPCIQTTEVGKIWPFLKIPLSDSWTSRWEKKYQWTSQR